MLWANFHPITLDSAIFFGPSAACASPRQWSFTQAKSGYLYFQYSTNGTNYLAIELGNYTQLNVYTHYAFVKNSSGVATYINGVYQGFVAFGSGYVGPLTYSPSPIFVGKGGCGYTDPNTQFSNSSMDNVALYNRTLTATEVAEGVNISGSTDGDGDVLTYYYEFYNINDTTTVQAYSTIGTYTIQVIDAHDIIRIRSKAFDGLTYSSEIESNATISNIMPTFNESNFVSIISHGVNISLQINASDTDADTLTYAINDTRFTINSSSGLINKTNSLSTVGEYNVTINVTDGTATISMSVFFNITNTAPTTPSVLSVNASLFVGEALVASASGSSDVDNDSLSYFYEFYNINDTSTVQAYSTTASYTVAVSDAHNIIRVRSKVYDGSVYSGVNESNTTINNSVPSFNESNFVSTISHGVNVSLQINASDTDADTLTYAINDTRFTINSSSGLINKTNSLSTVGEYNVTINVTDGTATISMSVFFNIQPHYSLIIP